MSCERALTFDFCLRVRVYYLLYWYQYQSDRIANFWAVNLNSKNSEYINVFSSKTLWNRGATRAGEVPWNKSTSINTLSTTNEGKAP